jgi:DNA-binding PadR family transcriptional regulator
MGSRGTPVLEGLGRYSGPATLVLSSLAEGPKHGYALIKDVETFAGVTLGPGTLYGSLSRLEAGGLIEAVAAEGRRRPYRLTAAGRIALKAQLDGQRRIAEVGLHRLSIGGGV